MLKIPSDMNVTDTSQAQAIKLSSRKIRENAYVKADADISLQIAARMDEAADGYLTLTKIPARGVGGEFVQTTGGKSSVSGLTREKIDRVNTDASLDRLELIHKNGVLNMALDVAEAVGAANAAEQMLAHQMAVAHRMGLDLMALAGNTNDPIEKCRLINTASKLMDTCQKGLLTINKVRNGGQQIMTVQHVHVTEGGQAVINGSAETRGVEKK